MLELSPTGWLHTAIALSALGAGLACLIRRGEIAWRWWPGRLYVIGTVLSCLTAFALFRHGGFSPGHGLAIVALVVLALAVLADLSETFGRFSRRIAALGYSTVLLLHLIPGLIETATRLPVAKPWASGPEDPRLQPVLLALFLIYLASVVIQQLKLRRVR